MACPNINLESWKNLVAARGEDLAYYLWDKYDGNVPESESKESIVKSGLKATNILQSSKANQFFASVAKNKISGDFFWKKMQADLGIPKDQLEILKSFDTQDRGELISSLLANYSYAIEINTATETKGQIDYESDIDRYKGYDITYADTREDEYQLTSEGYQQAGISDDGFPRYIKKKDNYDELVQSQTLPTQVYSNLTVPGGTNYTEQEIATPAITPSIKGHAQFSTDKGIGWFRSDDKQISGKNGVQVEFSSKEEYEYYKNLGFIDGPVINGRPTLIDPTINKTKTRRILEVQSDLFQKGRDSKKLNKQNIPKYNKGDIITNDKGNFEFLGYFVNPGDAQEYVRLKNITTGQEGIVYQYKFDERITPKDDLKANDFLQLLNKDNNWVTLFVKSIIQDSAKKGYEKVLFPTGNTASKVEGHTTLEEFKKQKEDRIKELESKLYFVNISNATKVIRHEFSTKQEAEIFAKKNDGEIRTSNNDLNEIKQLKQELERVETEEFGALKPIYNFYENTVTNILTKTYGKENVKQVTDEYGNTWNEITIVPERESSTVLFQTEDMPASKASPETIEKVKKILEKMGIKTKELLDYAKSTGIDVKGVTGLADLTAGIIAIAEGKEDRALTEEMVHLATAILEQTNPKMITEMISKIDRFKIYDITLKQYSGNKNYQLPNGKPDIRKIKKEAVDKLIAEIIVNKNENIDQFPELREEINQSIVRSWWRDILDYIRGIYKKSSISIFEEAAAQIISGEIGTVAEITGEGVFFQVSAIQQSINDKLDATDKSIEKVIENEKKADPLLLDSEEANNYYRTKKADGSWERVTKRVTDRVQAWYRAKFGAKQFTAEEKAFNELKRKYGVQGHKDLEEIHARFYNKDGTKRETPLDRPMKFDNLSEGMYENLENYYTQLIDRFPKNTIIRSEVVIYDKKNKEAGTLDFLAIEPSGKAHILDWKFMHIKGDDVAWFKLGAFNIQLGTYKKILRENYGIKEFGMTRAIPISMEFKLKDKKDPKSGFILGGIAVGSADPTQITDLRLIPVSEETESTGFEALDGIIKKLNALFSQINSEQVTDDQEKEFKRERLNTLRTAIRKAQGSLDIAPLIDVIEVMRKEGDRLLNDYNTTYKDRPARSNDSTNSDLSDFSDDMNNFIKLSDIFVNIHNEIDELIYTDEMLKQAKTEEQIADVKKRKEILNKLQNEASAIYKAKEKLISATLKFADKHIGQRNLVTGLLKPERILKGLAYLFRGAIDLPNRSIQILTRLTGDAQTRAAQDAFKEVEELMKIREKLAAKGGDLRKLIQQIYQKDDNNKLVNKLIYKYSREFHKIVDKKAETGGDMAWLLANIDYQAYKKEADEIIKKQIDRIEKQVYKGTEQQEYEQKQKEIEKIKRQWDMEKEDFDGWNNYVIKRHPLPKWYSEEYIKVKNDPELLELYNFISNFNEKAKDTGYIDNQVTKTFLPFIRKSMAEDLVWNNRLSVMDNFYKSLQINPDDVGYGRINEVTGELENSIPKYYTYDFTFKDGVNDYSQVSEDLFKNMILYIQQVNKYKYMTEVEGQLKLVKTIEEFKNHLKTNRVGNVVREGGVAVEVKGNVDNTKMYDDFLRVLLYEQKYVLSDSDVPLNVDKVLNFVKNAVNKVAGKEVWKPNEGNTATSLIKTIDAANRGFQLKTLGFEFISGAVNMFGGNIQIATQAGNYFKAREFAANEAKLTMQKFANEEDKEMFVQLLNTFTPMKDDPSYQMYKDAGMSALTRANVGDTLMFFMRQPELLIEKSVFLTLLQNMMIVNGKIVSINEFVKAKYKDRYTSAAKYNQVKDKISSEVEELKKTKSIDVTKKLVNGKLEIPGLDLNNKEELQRLTNLSRRMTANATGSMGKENVNRMSMSIWTKSMMVFNNWIPKLADTRFSEFRKVSDDFSVRIDENGMVEGEKYDIGRIRLLLSVLGEGVFTGFRNLNNIINLNDAGLERLDEMFEEFRTKYEEETGETLNMDRDQFIDLIRTNLRNQLKELAILGALFGVMLSLGFVAPDDDEDKATKNLYRYAQRVTDKFVGELSFFYNPAELEKTLSGGIFPAMGIAKDFSRFLNHFVRETTGLDLDPETSTEDVRKKAQPIKNLMKMLPVTKSAVTYLSIFNTEFAKEFDVTIQKENNR